MVILGQALSGWGIPFISAKATHRAGTIEGEVVCETQEQCDRVAERAAHHGWAITARVATPEEVDEHKKWMERW